MQLDIKYWKQLAAFAYESFLEHGDGVVLIKEKPSQSFSSADLDKYFQYIPFDPDNEEIPLDGVAMIVKYKPEKEVILMITDATGQTVCLQLSAEKLGITPLEAYKEAHCKLVPGQVYKLDKLIRNVKPGYYIFEKEDKAMLIFCRVGMDGDEGGICRTDKIIKVHLDFRDYFTTTEMNVRVE